MQTMQSQQQATPLHEMRPIPGTNWWAVLFLCLTPPAAILFPALYVAQEGFQLNDLIPFFILYALTGLSITAGYHRYFAHRTYECSRAVQFFYLLFGAAALQNSALNWVSDHRYHHQYADRDGDPYNIRKGFFWAHMGWMFPRYLKERPFKNAPDLKKDGLVMWQYRNYAWIVATVGFVLPTLIGAAFGRPMAGFLWGGLVRTVLVHHFTFCINSLAHTWGKKTYSEKNTARDSVLLALITYGEGYHSFHHAFPADYRNGIAWYHWDPSKWLIQALRSLGWAWKLRTTPPDLLAATRSKTLDPAELEAFTLTTPPIPAEA